MVGRGLQYIGAGDVFQVNLSHRMSAGFRGEPRGWYAEVAGASPAWYGAYLELRGEVGEVGKGVRTLASWSPELFLEVEGGRGEGGGGRRVVTRPIKGTLASSGLASALEGSGKDAAELHMIVDLMRNDLGRVCRFGSVRVEERRAIETHPTVHHGVATVAGELREGVTVTDLLRATFPGGSVTGVPKVRAMQIIEEVEPVGRGAYCGGIGLFHRGGMVLNLAIRTAMIEQESRGGAGRLAYSVGGGIVADSDPGAEWRETLAKAAVVKRSPRRGRGGGGSRGK